MEALIIIVIILVIVIPIYFTIKNNELYKEKLTENNALVMMDGAIHLSGLPTTGRESCSIMVKSDNVIINNNRQEFQIPMNKIIGAVVNQETRDVQTVQTTTKKSPSVGKAVVGGALFGPAGAVIGGVSGKSKSKSNVQTKTEIIKLYLTINYISEGEQRQLMFEGKPYCRFYDIQNNINTYASNGSSIL